MAGITAPSRAKSIGELQRFIVDWELRVAEHEARHNESVQDTVNVAALKRMMTAETAELDTEGPNTYPELRSRVGADAGEKMIQQCHAPVDIGEVEGEVEGSDDQIDELRGTSRPRVDGRSTPQRGQGKQPWKAPPSGRQEKREVDNGHDSGKNQKEMKRATVCTNCGGKGHPARLSPQRHPSSTRTATPTRGRRRRVMCTGSSVNVDSTVQATKMMTSWEWDGSPQNKAGGSVWQLWWDREQQKTFHQQTLALL